MTDRTRLLLRACVRSTPPPHSSSGTNTEADPMRHKRWKKLSMDELRGAHFALRVVRTSPTIRGRGLEILDGLLVEIASEYNARVRKKKSAGSAS